MVPQDRRVDPIREVRLYCIVRLGADPVVANGLLGFELRKTVSEGGGRPCYCQTHDERVPLCHEDLQRIRDHGVHVLTVGLDDRHVVSVDAEDVVRVAGQVDESEAVAVRCMLCEVSAFR